MNFCADVSKHSFMCVCVAQYMLQAHLDLQNYIIKIYISMHRVTIIYIGADHILNK